MPFFFLLFLAASAQAASPALSALEPWGAQRGKAVTVTLIGTGLTQDLKVLSTLPVTFTPLTPDPAMAGRRLPFLLEIKADTPTGLYPIRLQGPTGVSNVLLFSIGAFPELRESKELSVIKQLPVTINGNLKGPERDQYRFLARAGDRRVFEVEARRMGSALDPVIRILDSTGKQLARNDDAPGLGADPRLELTFPHEGEYTVEIHDAKFSDQRVNFYRLKMGAYPFAESIFPLGWQRGGDVTVELSGGNLAAPIRTRPDWHSVNPKDRYTLIRQPDSEATLPFVFAVGDQPEQLEPAGPGPHPLTLDTVMNARISAPGEVDRYTLKVTPGATYLLTVQARDLGTSRLIGVLSVFDETGKRIASEGDQPPKQDTFAIVGAGDVSADPQLVFEAPKSASQVTVTVEDLTQSGGSSYGYRLTARHQPPDFELSLVSPFVNVPESGTMVVAVNAIRRGFGGQIQLKIENLPPDLTVAGGNVPEEPADGEIRNVSRRGVLTLTAKHGAKPRLLELTVTGEAIIDGQKIVRRAASPGMITAVQGITGLDKRPQHRPFTAPWLNLDLPVGIAPPASSKIEVDGPAYVRIIQGQKYEAKVKGPERLSFDTPGARDLRIVKGKDNALSMLTTIGTPPSKFDLIVNGRVQEEVVFAPAITIEVVQGYRVLPPAGGGMVLSGKVEREKDFTAPISYTFDALPVGVSCQAQDTPEGGATYTITCQAGPEAVPGSYTFLINPSSILAGSESEKGKVPYKIPPVEAKMEVKK